MDKWWYYKILDITSGSETCGGNGGNGGNGGTGGAAGLLTINGPSDLEAQNTRQGGNPGNGGIGGIGANGLKCNRRYKGFYHTWEDGDCHGICDAKCGPDGSNYGPNPPDETRNDKDCNGKPGESGHPGEVWTP